jgi:6-phosphogluconolactonase
MTPQAVRWHVVPDATVLARDVAALILAQADAAIAERGEFRIVLAGGRTPAAIYELLGAAAAHWSGWRIFYGDERCLPPDHPERNSLMAARRWLDRVPVPRENIHVIPAELGPEPAARAYADTIRRALPFDLVLLGMGEDGHTASLFPGHVHATGELVHPVFGAPKPPAERVSLGLAALNAAAKVIILVTGCSKRDAVRQWKNGVPLPVACICPPAGVDVYLDALAADQ